MCSSIVREGYGLGCGRLLEVGIYKKLDQFSGGLWKKNRVLKGLLVWAFCLEWCIPSFGCLSQFKGCLGGGGMGGLRRGRSLGTSSSYSSMIGNWKWLGIFLQGSKSIQWSKMERIVWFGRTQRKETFQLNLSILFLSWREKGISLWKWFGILGFLRKWNSLHGRQYGIGFWPWIIEKGVMDFGKSLLSLQNGRRNN